MIHFIASVLSEHHIQTHCTQAENLDAILAQRFSHLQAKRLRPAAPERAVDMNRIIIVDVMYYSISLHYVSCYSISYNV